MGGRWRRAATTGRCACGCPCKVEVGTRLSLEGPETQALISTYVRTGTRAACARVPPAWVACVVSLAARATRAPTSSAAARGTRAPRAAPAAAGWAAQAALAARRCASAAGEATVAPWWRVTPRGSRWGGALGRVRARGAGGGLREGQRTAQRGKRNGVAVPEPWMTLLGC